MTISGLILAAGRSSRMGRDKALLEYRGDTFLNRQIFLILPRVARLAVVLGHHADEIRATLPVRDDLVVAINEEYDRGMLSSLQTGIAAFSESTDWYVFGLVDHPTLRGRTLDRIIEGCKGTEAPLVIPRFDGERGHPIAFSREVAMELMALEATASPQDVIRGHYDEAVFVDVDDSGVVTDVDLPEDFAKLSE